MNISSYGFKSRPEYKAKTPVNAGVFVILDPCFSTMKIKLNHTTEPVTEPVSITIEMSQKKYTTPKMYIPKRNGSPTIASGKRWYIYCYYRNPETGKLEKTTLPGKGLNRYKTVKERKAAGKALIEAYTIALARGWNPVTRRVPKQKKSRDMLLKPALEYALEIKSKIKKPSTMTGYEFHVNRFLEWAKINGYLGFKIERFNVDHFYEFLDYLRFEYTNENTGEGLSGTSVNNHKRSLSSLFTTLKNERKISTNFIKDIPNFDTDPVNNKAFTQEELIRIKNYFEVKDPYMNAYLAFIIYPLLRPREICRLKVRDLDLERFLFSVETKTRKLSTRRIIKKAQPFIDLLKIEGAPGGYELFSNLDQPRDWSSAKLTTRTKHFSDRFGKMKKALGFGREYGPYSCRHTAIVNLYNNMALEGMSEQEIIFKIMPYSDHQSVAGVKNYLRKHLSILPADHSELYTLDF